MTATEERPKYVNLISDVAAGAEELAAAHAEQLSEEIKDEADRATNVIGLFSAAGTFMGLGFIFAMYMAVKLIQFYYQLSDITTWGLTGAISFTTGIVIFFIARAKLNKLRWIPAKSFQSIKESVKWATRK